MSDEAIDWYDLPIQTREIMEMLGNFLPTIDGRQVKGYMFDSDCGHNVKTYFDATDLRDIAEACKNVADWIEKT